MSKSLLLPICPLSPFVVVVLIASVIVTFIDGQSFIPTCSNWNESCQDGVPVFYCLIDPCESANACSGSENPMSTLCHSNYCGGCHAVCCTPPSCFEDAMECPDGITFVSRDPNNNCEFFPCEDDDNNDDDSIVCAYDVKLCPDNLTEVSRDPENDCEFYPCRDDEDDLYFPILCTADVFICPDESFVSRDPKNNCEFFPCGNDDNDGDYIMCAYDVKLCPDNLTEVSRDPENDCEFYPCDLPLLCTPDVFSCPDGSLVARNSENNCEFFSC